MKFLQAVLLLTVVMTVLGNVAAHNAYHRRALSPLRASDPADQPCQVNSDCNQVYDCICALMSDYSKQCKCLGVHPLPTRSNVG